MFGDVCNTILQSLLGVCVYSRFRTNNSTGRSALYVRPSVRGQVHDNFLMLSISDQWISGLIEQKAIVGFASSFSGRLP